LLKRKYSFFRLNSVKLCKSEFKNTWILIIFTLERWNKLLMGCANIKPENLLAVFSNKFWYVVICINYQKHTIRLSSQKKIAIIIENETKWHFFGTWRQFSRKFYSTIKWIVRTNVDFESFFNFNVRLHNRVDE
jgi:hypothetical protein